jgi:hypothetical protein
MNILMELFQTHSMFHINVFSCFVRLEHMKNIFHDLGDDAKWNATQSSGSHY